MLGTDIEQQPTASWNRHEVADRLADMRIRRAFVDPNDRENAPSCDYVSFSGAKVVRIDHLRCELDRRRPSTFKEVPCHGHRSRPIRKPGHERVWSPSYVLMIPKLFHLLVHSYLVSSSI